MRQDCSECARLWEAYLAARREHAQAWREIDSAGAPDSAERKSAIQRAQEAFDGRERLRTQLAEHEAAAHGGNS